MKGNENKERKKKFVLDHGQAKSGKRCVLRPNQQAYFTKQWLLDLPKQQTGTRQAMKVILMRDNSDDLNGFIHLYRAEQFLHDFSTPKV